MDFDIIVNCKKCGSFKPWINIIDNNGENIKRKCKVCEILPVYNFVEFKNINLPGDINLCTAVYKPEQNKFIILPD